ncbi:PEP-CTERM sorting domain-containing protein [Scleromatobacter humisilvae]|uniref:PEP-CTERM sorting domain-containing protein n=1 Tax=Scleromatobacter humisilvae TaxID=2897159 RepID=A0A9X1YNF3_9BURK|nr:PEP-CTERM sorting domain-containing protein [Scleromatobacter humisilvae]MCK9689007.1 PEP-CTERM sorting domain-containing protein [Scleromatobacter humisilvae]
MKRLLSSLLLAAAGLAVAPFVSATVLTFDDLAGDDFVPANYGGLDWSAGDWFAFGDAQPPFSAHSGSMRIASGFGDADAATAIGLGDGRTFQGAWFAGYEDVDVSFKLYEHGALVATSATLATSATPTWLASGYAGLVDEVIVSSADQGGFVLDDLTFSAAVPEPASTALLACGLVALAAVARRRA